MKRRTTVMIGRSNDARDVFPLPPTNKWPDGVWEKQAFAHGSMRVSLFAPRSNDYQTQHDQDELYFVQSGSAVLMVEVIAAASSRYECRSGDVYFVAAGTLHRFKEMSEDFTTWVVFWGPPGGEDDAPAGDLHREKPRQP
jgi:mannose-6-phosphate isomerase-like protein (cupin superfamily)